MRKFILFTISILLIFVLASCQNVEQYDIVTTMFPQYSLTKEIVGDNLTVDLITPPGVNVHNFELSSKDIIKIDNSKLFLYTSDIIDPQIKNMNLNKTKVVNLSTLILHGNETNNDAHDHDDDTEHEHNHSNSHYWTSYENLIKMTNIIFEEIINIDPDKTDIYQTNRDVLLEKLTSLKTDLLEIINKSSNAKIYFAGHDSMASLSDEVGLEIVTLIDDIKPNADITSLQITNLVNDIKENNVKYLYIPELESTRIAETIQRNLSSHDIEIKFLELHGFHNITLDQFKNETSILILLQQNNINIEKGLK